MPNGSISPSEIPNELAQNKLCMQGVDKNGRPIVVAFGARHKQAKLDDFKRMPNAFLLPIMYLFLII